jgi:anti-sigma-K factor RskA
MMAVPSDHSARHDELLPAYALGALDGGELREMEEHIAAGCPECRRQIPLWQGDLEELAAAVDPVEPSDETRRRILRLTGKSAAPAPLPLPFPGAAPARAAAPRWLALAAAALLAVAVWGFWGQTRLRSEAESLRAERDRLAEQVTALDRRLGEAQSDNQRLAETLTLITAPGARAVQLAGLGSNPGAVGHTFINYSQKKAIVYAFGLAPLPAGKTYELWWIDAGGKPVPAGTFGVDARGSARVVVDRVEGAEGIMAWAVTSEPAGGVPQPTGEMVLKG